MLDLLLFLCLVRTFHHPMWGGNHRWRPAFVVCLVTATLLGASPFTGSAHAAPWSFRERRVHLARGLTLLEIGHRTGDRNAIERAGTVFEEIGARARLQQALALV